MRTCECGSKVFDHDEIRGELVCCECGLVVMENMPVAEARYVRLTGSDHSMPLSFSTQNPVNRIKVKTHQEKRMEAIYHTLRHKDVTPETRERALHLAKKYLRLEGRLPVHSVEEFADALVYLACREERRPYKLKARLRIMKKVRKSLTRAGVVVWCRYVEPKHYLDRIIAELELSPEVRGRAMDYLDSINNFTPATRAAAAVVLALQDLGKEAPYGRIAESAGVSDSTLWKARKRLKASQREGTEEKEKEKDEDEAPSYVVGKLMEASRG